MRPRHLPAHAEALEAIAAVTGADLEMLRAELLSAAEQDPTAAGADAVRSGLSSLSNRVALSPALDQRRKRELRSRLAALRDDPPALRRGDVAAWATLLRTHPPSVPTLVREPLVLPTLDEPQETAWHLLLDLDRDLSEPWVLVGGQMTMLHCLENGIDAYRATDDGDVVLGVWTHRSALGRATHLVQRQGFEPQQTLDGFGYRYARGRSVLDLLLPEGLERQRRQPRTATGRPGFAVDGGNQALIRAERLPVRLADRTGHVRRPSILGALVGKAAALRSDTRDRDRHREDIALLGYAALLTGFRTMRTQTTPHDRQRLRRALAMTPPDHPAWRRAPEAKAVVEGLSRLAQHPGRG